MSHGDRNGYRQVSQFSLGLVERRWAPRDAEGQGADEGKPVLFLPAKRACARAHTHPPTPTHPHTLTLLWVNLCFGYFGQESGGA